jgi:hypothetical protein
MSFKPLVVGMVCFERIFTARAYNRCVCNMSPYKLQKLFYGDPTVNVFASE